MDYEEFNALEPSKKTMDRIKDILTYRPMTLEEISEKIDIDKYDIIICLDELMCNGSIVIKKDSYLLSDNPQSDTCEMTKHEDEYYGLTNWQPISKRILKEIIE